MDNKKKFLFIGQEGKDLSLALEVCARDTDVFYYSEPNVNFPRVESFKVGYGFERFGIHLVNDFYSILKTAKDPEHWVVVLTDSRLGDLAKWLREEKFNVLGGNKECSNIVNDHDYGRIFMQKAGIDIPTPNQRENIPGFTITTSAFFNGEEFLYPVLRCYDTPGGGYMSFFKACPLMKMGMEKIKIPLKQIEFHGVVNLNGTFVPRGLWGEDQPVRDLYLGNSLFPGLDFPRSRVYFKMIENLAETIENTASGNDDGIKLLKKDAFYFNAFRDNEVIQEEDFYPLGKIYEFEREEPERFGIAFEQVTMDSTGDLGALPNNHQLFQLIGFGNSYLEAVSASTDLLHLGQSYVKFKTSKQETLENIRDRVVFVESWLGEKNEDQDENS